MQRWHDCRCEDFPCCGHFDTIEAEPSYCDDCGGSHAPTFDCTYYEEDEEEDEEPSILERFGDDEPQKELPNHYGDTPFHEEDYE